MTTTPTLWPFVNRLRSLITVTLVAVTAGVAGAQTADTRSATVPGPARILKETARDFAGLSSLDALTVLAIGAGSALALHPVDDDINWQLAGSDFRFLGPGDALGHVSPQTGIAVATYLTGRAIDSQQTTAVGQQLIRSQVVTQLSTLAIKTATRRQRPDGSNHRSFPSGHASTTFAAATILSGNFGWRVSLPAYALATYVATSRLHENRHYISDVVFGSALGIAAARVTLRRDRQSRALMQPVLLPGGAAVSMTW